MLNDLTERLPDRRRICVLLRGDGWSYEEIADFLGVSIRLVRAELEAVTKAYPGLLDHRRDPTTGRLMRLVYLLGVMDAGVPTDELPDWLESLPVRASWLRSRARLRDSSDLVG